MRCILLQLIVEETAVLLEALDIICKAFKLTLRRHWLLQQQLNTLQSLPLVIELAAQDLIVQLSIFPGVASQIIQHFVRAQVLRRDLLRIVKSLLDGEDLLLVEVNHLRQLSLLLREFGILLLLLSQFACCLEKSLEVLLVALVLKEVDLGEQLVLLLFELRDLLLQLRRVHALLTHLVHVLMGRLELRLQIFVRLESLLHLLVDQELVRNGDWHEKLGRVRPSLQLR